MRKLAIGMLAVPVLAVVYVTSALRRSALARVGLALGMGGLLAFGVINGFRPAPAAATPPTVDLPLTSAVFKTVLATDLGLLDPVSIQFSSPMDERSVAASVAIQPAVPVTLQWDAAGLLLTIVPQTHWSAGTLHSITVDAGALAANGAPMMTPARAAFVTRDLTTGTLALTDPVGKRVGLDSGFSFAFDHPVDAASVRSGLTLDPSVQGTFESTTGTDGRTEVVFTPLSPLKAGTTYHLTLTGVVDADGVPVEPISSVVKTVVSPGVVRFRPLDRTTAVARDSVLSVRFTQPMDRSAARAAFTVTAAGKAIKGAISFAENDTVLVFRPTKVLPYASKVIMTVGKAATSRDGVPLGKAVTGQFKTIAKPKPGVRAGGGGGGGSVGGGGGAVGGGSWAAVETYYLGLMNCTRTGGWVTSGGSCTSPGGRDVAPLKLDSGISTHVSRPYAKKLAVGNDCSHFIGGNPGDRLSAAGYHSYRWAENIGCRSGGAKSAVLGSHRFFQDEKSSNGGHYVNLMNAKYDRVGIGVWVSNGRVRLVVDFYHP